MIFYELSTLVKRWLRFASMGYIGTPECIILFRNATISREYLLVKGSKRSYGTK
jgi:hypothetical protein